MDEYVGISHFIQELHENNGFFKNADKHVIYNAVKEIKSNKQSEVRRIGFIGRLTIEKGFDVFCRIADKNKEKYSFIAAGNYVNNYEQAELNQLAKSSGVVVKGYMKLGEFLDQIDAVVLPIKWNEPFGRTVVECVLAGKLVLTNPVGAMKELSLLLPNIIISNDIGSDFDKKISQAKLVPVDSGIIDKFTPEEIANQYLCIYNEKESL